MTFNSHRRADISQIVLQIKQPISFVKVQPRRHEGTKNSDNAALAGDYLSSRQRRQSLTESSELRRSAWRKKDGAENDGPYNIDDADNLDDILRELNK